jgi:hypothetical protein
MDGLSSPKIQPETNTKNTRTRRKATLGHDLLITAEKTIHQVDFSTDSGTLLDLL